VWLQTWYGLVNGFIDSLYTRLTSTSNYIVTANLHNSQITTAPAKPFPGCCVFMFPGKRLLTVEILQLHALRFDLHYLPSRTLAIYHSFRLSKSGSGYRLDDRSSLTGTGKNFFLANMSRPAVGPSQPPLDLETNRWPPPNARLQYFIAIWKSKAKF
jgi:hypothetical protein